MSGNIRVPIDRPDRRLFTDEAVRLFVELERVAPSRRFEDPRTKQLAQLLGLMGEYFSINYVNKTGGPPIPLLGQQHWATCRQMRARLLEAAGLAKARSSYADADVPITARRMLVN